MADELSNVKSYYKGQTVYKEGQPGSTAYVVKKGSVTLFRTQNNRKQMLGRLGTGEIFGEMGALAGAPRTNSAEAAEYCELMVITRQMLGNLLEQSPKTIKRLLKVMTQRVREAEARSGPAPDHRNTFMAVCRLLHMADQNHLQLPPAQARKDPQHNLGLRRTEFSRMCKDVLLISQMEIDRVLEQLGKLKLIEVNVRSLDKAFTEKFIKISDPKNFLQVAANLRRELKDQAEDQAEMEYIDIFDFADEVESTPEILYKKLAQGEMPESLFFFPQKSALEWAQTKGRDFFKRVKRRRKKIEEIEDVNDLIYVDRATLKEALSVLGYYKTGVLLSLAGNETREKILSTLAKKIARVVEEEAERRGNVDEGEALDVQDEIIAMIKTIKGAGAK